MVAHNSTRESIIQEVRDMAKAKVKGVGTKQSPGTRCREFAACD